MRRGQCSHLYRPQCEAYLLPQSSKSHVWHADRQRRCSSTTISTFNCRSLCLIVVFMFLKMSVPSDVPYIRCVFFVTVREALRCCGVFLHGFPTAKKLSWRFFAMIDALGCRLCVVVVAGCHVLCLSLRSIPHISAVSVSPLVYCCFCGKKRVLLYHSQPWQARRRR